MRVTQLLPSVHSGDAIGDSAYEIHTALRQKGIESYILGVNIDDHLKDRAIDFSRFAEYDSPDATHIYHFAVPSPITYRFREAQGRKIVIYHNITPPCFFEGFSEELVAITTTGRHEIKLLADSTDLGLADSEFNRKELVAYGFRNTGVLPILLDFAKYGTENAPHILEQFDDENVNLLFVGRVTPNKRQDDLLRAFAVYKRFVNPQSRLLLVGKYHREDKYVWLLHELIAALGLEDVYFSGHVSQQELNTYYRVADVFLSLSEHEGFCVPAVESMYFDVPVLAYNCTALPYTLGESGILINQKRYAEIAEMIQQVVDDSTFRQRILAKQRVRLEHFRKEKILALLFAYLGLS